MIGDFGVGESSKLPCMQSRKLLQIDNRFQLLEKEELARVFYIEVKIEKETKGKLR